MDAPDPESFSLLAKVVAAGVAFIAPVWGARTWLEKRFDKKADKHVVTSQLQAVTSELATQRGHIGKLFDKLAESEQRGEERHREILMHLLEKRP